MKMCATSPHEKGEAEIGCANTKGFRAKNGNRKLKISELFWFFFCSRCSHTRRIKREDNRIEKMKINNNNQGLKKGGKREDRKDSSGRHGHTTTTH